LKKKREREKREEETKKQEKGIFTVISVVINLYLTTIVICLNVFMYMSYVELSFVVLIFILNFISRYFEGMFQSKFSLQDNNILSYLKY